MLIGMSWSSLIDSFFFFYDDVEQKGFVMKADS